jgi:hypothetical protein
MGRVLAVPQERTIMAVGAPEILLLLLLAGGPAGSDIVSMVDPATYFESRQIDLTIDKMAGLAATVPEDGKAQMMQLLALRYLAEHHDKLKQADKYASHRKLLEEMAAGKVAQDPQGFAKEYAALVLARLDAKTLPPPEVPRLQSVLDWFPADATIMVAADLRRLREPASTLPATAEILRRMPVRDRQKLFAMMEKVGNVRVDRFALAFTEDKEPAKGKIYVRITGKANAAWLRSTIQQMDPRFEEKEYKDRAGGKTIAVLRAPEHPPVILFVEPTELLLVGYAREQGTHEDLVEEVLAARAGKEPNVTAGPHKDRLQKIPANALALAVGDLPAEMRKELGRDIQKIATAVPQRLDAYIETIAAGFDVHVTAGMTNAEEAQATVMQIAKLRKEGIDNLQKKQKQPDADLRMPVNALINLLQSLQVQSEGADVRLRVLISRELLQQLPGWLH